MNDDLLKSVREVAACARHRKQFDESVKAIQGVGAFGNPRDCDDCLRLVLAHCGEKAVDRVERGWFGSIGRDGVIAVLRREFGVTLDR